MSASFSINLTFFTKLPNVKKKKEKMKFDDREKWEPRFAMSCMTICPAMKLFIPTQ